MKRLLGLYRERAYSPGRHQSNDARLLDQIAHRLRERGFIVDLLQIEQAPNPPPDITLTFSMCQGINALERLAEWEDEGMHIINSPRAALNTHRNLLPQLMVAADISFPETQLLKITDYAPDPSIPVDGGVWLKRGDVHASVTADVQWIDSIARLHAGCRDFASRGIGTAAVQAHRPGDEIKFYGIGEGHFFHWYYSGESRGYPFDVSALPRLATRAAAAAGLEIFGGDVIVSASGELTLIDLNDWPSFAPCREQAAYSIGDYITRRVHA